MKKFALVMFLVAFSILPLLPLPFFFFYGEFVFVGAMLGLVSPLGMLFGAVALAAWVIAFKRLVQSSYQFYMSRADYIEQIPFLELIMTFLRFIKPKFMEPEMGRSGNAGVGAIAFFIVVLIVKMFFPNLFDRLEHQIVALLGGYEYQSPLIVGISLVVILFGMFPGRKSIKYRKLFLALTYFGLLLIILSW